MSINDIFELAINFVIKIIATIVARIHNNSSCMLHNNAFHERKERMACQRNAFNSDTHSALNSSAFTWDFK